ncbi:Hint domain-containing protein [Pseudooctadecabacter jejudonensis]|uniref:Hedgehog/Intein (Hint) domain-containing protein n=1 Tax=Pseudooctadecabacter jejudonensis TaxID=1391910 RepID=A0A1Y5S4C9_9RHOB|nr:Hint domain-containing protein [Pseudooctadecabacter jejudonensis]SLN30968.1 hypothetical protein PSJ8397_01417 [Pseudooctadecabacter jejudonensis]
MTLNWIATRTPERSAFHPKGLGATSRAAPVGMELLARGSLLIEATTRPVTTPVNLLRFSVLDPWPSGVKICLEPDGTVRLMIRQGERYLETALKTGLGGKTKTAQIALIWDAPRRRGRFSVFVPDNGHLWQTDVMAPFPLSMRDVRRIVTDTERSTIDSDVSFVAVADAPCPLGPIPGLAESSAVDTPGGPVLIQDLKPGDLVCIEGRAPVRALWVGHTSMPTLGRFAPMKLRRPYMGLWDDLVTTMDQRVCLSGSEVEYLFGEERVATAVRHLEIRNCAAPVKAIPPVMRYYQVLLETHEIMRVNGALVESFDGSAALANDAIKSTSVLADMPAHLRPREAGLAAPVLQGFEALTLTGATIG